MTGTKTPPHTDEQALADQETTLLERHDGLLRELGRLRAEAARLQSPAAGPVAVRQAERAAVAQRFVQLQADDAVCAAEIEAVRQERTAIQTAQRARQQPPRAVRTVDELRAELGRVQQAIAVVQKEVRAAATAAMAAEREQLLAGDRRAALSQRADAGELFEKSRRPYEAAREHCRAAFRAEQAKRTELGLLRQGEALLDGALDRLQRGWQPPVAVAVPALPALSGNTAGDLDMLSGLLDDLARRRVRAGHRLAVAETARSGAWASDSMLPVGARMGRYHDATADYRCRLADLAAIQQRQREVGALLRQLERAAV